MGGVKEFNNQQESVEFDLYTMTGRYYEKPCCGWRNEVGRSQLGGWHISVGDEVKGAFKLLSVNLYTDTFSQAHKHMAFTKKSTNTHNIYCKQKSRQIPRQTHIHAERGAHSCWCAHWCRAKTNCSLWRQSQIKHGVWFLSLWCLALRLWGWHLTKHPYSHTQEVVHVCNHTHIIVYTCTKGPVVQLD